MSDKKTRGPSYDREILVSKVSMMRIKGKSTYFILDFLMEKVGMSRKLAYDVIADAQKEIVDMNRAELKTNIAESISQLENMMDDTSDKKLKLNIRQELNKLMGLYAAEKIDVSVDFKAKFPGFNKEV